MNIETLTQSGIYGLTAALLVLVLVYAGRYVRLIKNGDVARVVNLVLSVLVSGISADPNKIESQIILVVCALASAGVHELLDWLAGKFPVDLKEIEERRGQGIG